MDKSLDQALAYSTRWLDLIKTPVVNEEQGKADHRREPVQLRRALQPGVARLSQVGDRGRRLGRDRVDRLRRGLSGCPGPRISGLPRRLRDDGSRLEPPGRRGRGEGAARAHPHAQPGADRPAARGAGPADGRDHARRPQVQLLLRQRHRVDRGRAQAGENVHPQERLHRRRQGLPRQDDGLAEHDRQVRLPPAGRHPLRRPGLPRALRRRGRGREAARHLPQGRRRHRRRADGADPGRGGRHRAAGRLLAAAAGDDEALRRAAHRRRSADRAGAHRQAVGRGSLERRAGYPRGGEVAGRRRDADQRLLLHRGDLAGDDVPQPVHPHHDDGRRGAGVLARRSRRST